MKTKDIRNGADCHRLSQTLIRRTGDVCVINATKCVLLPVQFSEIVHNLVDIKKKVSR